MATIDNCLHIPSESIVHETEHWVINHNFASALPGYLILGSKAPVDSLADLPSHRRSQGRPSPKWLRFCVQRLLGISNKPDVVVSGYWPADTAASTPLLWPQD